MSPSADVSVTGSSGGATIVPRAVVHAGLDGVEVRAGAARRVARSGHVQPLAQDIGRLGGLLHLFVAVARAVGSAGRRRPASCGSPGRGRRPASVAGSCPVPRRAAPAAGRPAPRGRPRPAVSGARRTPCPDRTASGWAARSGWPRRSAGRRANDVQAGHRAAVSGVSSTTARARWGSWLQGRRRSPWIRRPAPSDRPAWPAHRAPHHRWRRAGG